MSYQEKLAEIKRLEAEIFQASAKANADLQVIGDSLSCKIKEINESSTKAIEAIQAEFNTAKDAAVASYQPLVDTKKALEAEAFGACEGKQITLSLLAEVVGVVIAGFLSESDAKLIEAQGVVGRAIEFLGKPTPTLDLPADPSVTTAPEVANG